MRRLRNPRWCDGCKYEFEDALDGQDNRGLYLATSIDREFIPMKYGIQRYIRANDKKAWKRVERDYKKNGRTHFSLFMVDKTGHIVSW